MRAELTQLVEVVGDGIGELRNLQEHAAALGGEIRFSALSPGTRIELRFPSSRPA